VFRLAVIEPDEVIGEPLTVKSVLVKPTDVTYESDGMSPATNARNVGVAAAPVVGPAKTKFAFWLLRVIPKVPLVVIGAPLPVKMAGSDKPTDVTVPVPGVNPSAVVTSELVSVTTPVLVLKELTPLAPPFDAAVINPFAFTVMLAFVNEPTLELTVANVVEIAVAPDPVISPESVIVWLPEIGVKPSAVVTSPEVKVTAPVLVLKLVTPPADPFDAAVNLP
jgi:hypothetical protein